MPTLIRFVIVLVVLAGLGGAAAVYLAYFVEPNSRDMTIRVPSERMDPNP